MKLIQCCAAALVLLHAGVLDAIAQELPVWRVELRPSVTIGSDDTRPGHALHRVRAAVRLSDGRIVVADGGSSELRYFSPTGDLIRRTGGPGRGPAEFRVLQDVTRLEADSLLVLSLDPAFILVDASGEIVQKAPLDLSRIRLPCVDPEGGLHLLPDRSLIIQSEVTGCGPRRLDLHRRDDLITRVVLGNDRVDTVGVFPGTERNGTRYRAFGRMLTVAVAADRLFVGDSGNDSIGVYTPAGQPIAIWELPITPTTVGHVNLPRRQSYTLPDGTSARAPAFALPDTYPLYGRLLGDRTGSLWVMRYPAFEEPISSWRLKSLLSGWLVDPAGADWLVLDAEGHSVARVRTPPGVMVLEIGSDYVLGLSRNELDVESVSLYRLRR